MLAVHLEHRRVEVKRVPRPRAPKGFALIRLLCGGICNTDLELQRGYYGFTGTPGHEFVGEVEEADDRDWIGQRVVGEINLNCGACDWCRRGLGRHCPNRTVLGIVKHPGAFAEYLTLPERNLRSIPRSFPVGYAVFVEPLAAACEILEQVRIPAGGRVAVLGDGKLGLLIGQALCAHDLQVHQFGRHKEKLKIVERVGVVGEIARKLPVAEYDWVVDATGSAEGLQQAIGMTCPRGTVILKSTVHGLAGIDTAPVIVNELTLVGSRCGPFEPAIQLLVSRKVRVDDMISAIVHLDSTDDAFVEAERKGALKVLVHCSNETIP